MRSKEEGEEEEEEPNGTRRGEKSFQFCLNLASSPNSELLLHANFPSRSLLRITTDKTWSE